MVPNSTYVLTSEVKAAVEGRETEVLEELGIPWQDGQPCIQCPFPDHPDANPSWRWDQDKGRAFCTCESQDIFGIVAKVEGLDFGAAKLRVTEILGCTELIRQRKRSRFGAEDLLNPTPDQADDDLPAKYLAHRLDVPVDAVPVPSTGMAGWKGLPYYD